MGKFRSVGYIVQVCASVVEAGPLERWNETYVDEMRQQKRRERMLPLAESDIQWRQKPVILGLRLYLMFIWYLV